MRTRSRIAIIEDNVLLADSLSLALRAEGLDVTIGDVNDETALLSALAPDESLLVILDLDLGAPIYDGAHLIPALRAAGARVLVVTGSPDIVRVATAVERGAVGYLGKDQPFEILVSTVLRAAERQPVLDSTERESLLAQLRAQRGEENALSAPTTAANAADDLAAEPASKRGRWRTTLHRLVSAKGGPDQSRR